MFQIVVLSILDCNETLKKKKEKKVMLMGRSPEILRWLEDVVRQSRHYCNLLNQPSSAFPNCSFSETGSLVTVALLSMCQYCSGQKH